MASNGQSDRMTDSHVTNNHDLSRFEVFLGDELAGFAEYQRNGDTLSFTHTEVAERFEGKGLAGQLARAALDEARAEDLAVLPYCPYIARWIGKHPEYAELVPQSQRARFNL